MKESQADDHPKKHSKPRRFRRFLKTFFLIFVFLLVAVTGGVIYLYYTTDPSMLVDVLSDEIKARYSRELRVDKIEVSILKGVSLQGITVSKRGGFRYGTSLNFKDGSLIYNPVALIQREFDIVRISVGGFYSTYENLVEVIEDITKDIKSQDSSAKSDSPFLSFRIRSIEINDSQFLYNNIPLNFRALIFPEEDLNDWRFDVAVRSMYGNFGFDGKLSHGDVYIREADLSKFGEGIPALNIDTVTAVFRRVDDNTLALDGKKVRLKFGDFDVTSYTEFSGSYGIRGQSILIRDLGLKVNNSRAFVERFSYHIRSKRLDANIKRIEANLSDFYKEGSGNITGNLDIILTERMLLSGQLEVSNLNYAFIEKANASISADRNRIKGDLFLNTSGGNLDISVASENLVSSPIRVNVRSSSLDILPFLEDIAKDSSKSEKTGEDKGESPKLPQIAPVHIDVRIDKMMYDKFEMQDVTARGIYRNNVFNLENLRLVLYRGIMTGEGQLINNVFSGSLKYEDGRLREFSQVFFDEPRALYGNVDMDLRFRLNLDNQAESIAQLNVRAHRGEIRNFIIQRELSQILHNVPLDNIFFDNVTLNASLRDNKLSVIGFNFDSRDIKINATGDVMMEDFGMNFKAFLSVSDDYLLGLPNIARLYTMGFREGNRVNFNLKISGKFDKPSVSIER
jgi:hypothetical protein